LVTKYALQMSEHYAATEIRGTSLLEGM